MRIIHIQVGYFWRGEVVIYDGDEGKERFLGAVYSGVSNDDDDIDDVYDTDDFKEVEVIFEGDDLVIFIEGERVDLVMVDENIWEGEWDSFPVRVVIRE